LPRFRYDQLQRLGWQTLIPLSLLNIFVTSAVVIALS
jgi:NADH-quinone oxidoreductase subunit H